MDSLDLTVFVFSGLTCVTLGGTPHWGSEAMALLCIFGGMKSVPPAGQRSKEKGKGEVDVIRQSPCFVLIILDSFTVHLNVSKIIKF